MFSAIRGTARLTRRAAGPAAVFGAGYTASWSQSREETAPQLLAYGTASAWTVATGGVRSFGFGIQNVLPEEYRLEWPQKHLDNAETAELAILFQMVKKFEEQGVDSALLRRLALRRLCECVEADPRGPAILSLVGEDDSLSGIIALLDENVVALATASQNTGNEEGLLLPLTASLQAIVKSSKSRLDQELGVPGLLHLKRAALLSSTWLAESQKMSPTQKVEDSSGASTVAHDLEQDLATITERLHSVWTALGLPGNAAMLQRASRERGEVAELFRDVEKRAQELKAMPILPPRQKPLEEYLPKDLLSVLAGGNGRDTSRKRDRPAAADKRKSADSTASTADTKKAASTADSPPRSTLKTMNQVLEVVSWAILITAGIVAASEDGFGLLPFHALPAAMRPFLHELIQRHSSRVEDLLAKHDSNMTGGSSARDSATTLGPKPWDPQTGYITVGAPDVQGSR